MAPLTDPERKKHYFTALDQREVTGYVILKPSAAQRLLGVMSDYGFTLRSLCSEMASHRGQVKEVRETRSDFEHDFHYDFILPSPDGRSVYVETVLNMELDPLDSTVVIVSIHEP